MSVKAFLALTAAATAVLLVPSDARACGGGVSHDVDEAVAVGGQRVFVSVRDAGTTDIVVQLDVDAASDYGVLLPVPSEPTLDDTPVDARELDTLDSSTQVHFYEHEDASASSSGCGLGSTDAGAVNDFGANERVSATSFVTIGSVDAVILKADSSAALTAWLDEHGFSIPAGEEPIVDQYIGGSRHFIAFKRAEGAAPGHSSVGVHFTLDGDQRGYPLRMAKMGSSSELAITVFVSAESGVAPSAPFEALTLDKLGPVDGFDAEEIAESYRSAIRAAVAQRNGKAFVLEGVYRTSEIITSAATPGLAKLIDPGKRRLTRISTVVSTATLDTDVEFTALAPSGVPFERALGEAANTSQSQGATPALLFLLLGPIVSRLRRRR